MSLARSIYSYYISVLALMRSAISGKDGADARVYQEQDVNNALQKIKEIEQEENEE